MTEEYRWANTHGANGMPRPVELWYLGYRWVCRHPFWWASVLMRRRSA